MPKLAVIDQCNIYLFIHVFSDQEQAPLTARLQPYGIDQIVEILEDTTFKLNINMRQFVELNQT